jgi:signal-transduction protein with cAMP-binding, CBS, and nucleotidyltransferase domain
MTGHVVALDYDTPLEEVVNRMREERIGSVLVTRHEKRYGIFTERDLMSVLASPVPDFASPIGARCSRPVLTASVTSTVKEAVSTMKKNRIKRLPVTKGRKIVGIVTARDIVEAYAKL